MASHREDLRPEQVSDSSKTPRLWEDLLTGLSLGVFLVLLTCVFVGAWLYERGI